MSFMNAIDTNVWLYAHDVRDPIKQRIALDLIRDLPAQALVWQVGCEFIAASRKLIGQAFTSELAWDTLEDM
jgi:predicted nucleic acid-binding protein